MEIYLVGQLRAIFFDRLGLVPADVVLGPLGPADHAEMSLERHKERVILDPCVGAAKLLKLRGVLLAAAAEGDTQHVKAVLIYLAVVDSGGVIAPVDAGELRLFQELILYEQVEVDKVGVPRKGGEGGIGAVAVARGTQRQELPVSLPGVAEKVYEFVCAFAHGADTVIRRQAAHGHEYTAAAVHKNHPLCVLFWLSP